MRERERERERERVSSSIENEVKLSSNLASLNFTFILLNSVNFTFFISIMKLINIIYAQFYVATEIE
mgnify:CR=1 FL=1